MARLLLWAVIGLAVWWWLRQGRARLSQRSGTPTRPSAPTTGDAALPQHMLRCSHCGVFLPQGDAVMDEDGQAYCCTEHRTARRRSG